MKKVWRLVVPVLLAWSLVFTATAQGVDEGLEDKGVVATGVYESPQFDNRVTWTEDWAIDGDGLATDGDLLLDKLSLYHEDQATAVIMFVAAGAETSEDYARRLVRYRTVTDPAAEVVWSETEEDVSLLLYQSAGSGRAVVSLIEIRLVAGKDTLQIVELIVYPEYAASVFDLTQSDIEIDNRLPFATLDEFPGDQTDEELSHLAKVTPGAPWT